MGSSPRMRGAVGQHRLRHHEPGIIPAHAGSSCAHASTFLFGWDHPRACGEQVSSAMSLRSQMGSSPRMRGAVEIAVAARYVLGIIPAHAGSRSSVTGRTSPSRDHPRACGEQSKMLTPQAAMSGSSPRVRGAVDGAPSLSVVKGIIPARAGSSDVYVRTFRVS